MPTEIQNDDIATVISKLKARENNFQNLESMANLGSWEVDLENGQSIWSDQSFKIYGLDKDTTKPTLNLFLSLLLPEYVDKAKEAINKTVISKIPNTFECKAKRSDGEIIDLLLNGQAIFDNNGVPIKLIGTTQDITKHVSLKRYSDELSSLMEYSSNEIYIIDKKTYKYLYVNQGACDALGYSKEEFLNLDVYDLNPKLTVSKVNMLKNLCESNEKGILNRSIHRRKDGTLYHVQSFIHNIKYNNTDAYVIFDTDISDTIELELKHEQQAMILEHIHDSVISTDYYGQITSYNRGSKLLLGYEENEMLGKTFLDIYHPSNEHSLKSLFELLELYGEYDMEAYLIKKDGSRVICDISLSILKDSDGRFSGMVAYSQDITEKKEAEKLLAYQTERLNHQAHHDTLTQLPNRTLFRDRLSQAISTSSRNSKQFALLFIDLDQFKKVNDSLGHQIGDKVLVEASIRLQNSLRENDTLARLGGDEFTVIINDIKTVQDASTVADKIISAMKKPMIIDNHTLYISTSIGISVYPKDTTDEEDLTKFADTAMYRAKDEGRDNYQFYSSDMTAFAFERVLMENNLRTAIKENQFVVYFQPQFDASNNTITGMEALVRWQHPVLGLISPDKFLPIAEETGLIIEIDLIVMRESMQEFVKWYKAGLNPGVLALNLAMKQLNSKDFMFNLLSIMNELHFQPEWLELEVTEGQVMNNPEASIVKLNQINSMGIELAIDDFGTGYSSLAYLKKLPLDKLKIDRSFVKDIPHDEDDIEITKAIIALAKSLNLKIIAEGVETEEQRDFLLKNDCLNIQGYFYSRPLSVEDITDLLIS